MKASEFRKLIREEVRRVLKEVDAPLDPNATYMIQIGTSRGEYDPMDLKKVSGNPLTVAKAVKKKTLSDFEGTDAPLDIIDAFKIDNDTYMVVIGEEDVVIVGRPKSTKYGAFWTDPNSKASEKLFNKMEDDMAALSGEGGEDIERMLANYLSGKK